MNDPGFSVLRVGGERTQHEAGRIAVVRRFLSGLVRELFPRPLVEVTGSQYVDVIVNRTADHDELAVHLVNTAGPHHERDVYTFDEIPPVGPLEITIRTGEKPKAVRREPSGEEISFTFADGQLHCTLPRLDIHTILVVA